MLEPKAVPGIHVHPHFIHTQLPIMDGIHPQGCWGTMNNCPLMVVKLAWKKGRAE
jgi:hypothetical protein